eukprot:RCo050587
MERVRNRPRRTITHTVVMATELEQLASIVDAPGAEKHRREQEEREKLKGLSEERVKHWPNTIEALRLRKEQDRRDRLAEEEAVKQKLDVEEAEFQEAQRKAAIERANLMLYEQDDRIKTLTSKMLLSHVLEERNLQLTVKEQKKEMEKTQEQHWHSVLQEQLKKAREEEEVKQAAARAKAKQIQMLQKDQLAETQNRMRRQEEEQHAETLAIRAAAEKSVLEELNEENARRQKARDLAQEYAQTNQELKKYKALQAEKEAVEDQRIERFAKVKEEQMAERKRRADEKFRRDMERRQAIIQRQAEHLAALKDQHEERLSRQMAALAKEKEEREVGDKNKQLKILADIHASRKRQLEAKQRRKEQNDREAAEYRQQWVAASEQMLIEDLESKQARRDKNVRLLEFQKMQMKEKEVRAKDEREQEKIEGEMMKRAMAEEEEMFTRYVDTVMSEYSTKGRNLDTMRSIKQRGNATF